MFEGESFFFILKKLDSRALQVADNKQPKSLNVKKLNRWNSFHDILELLERFHIVQPYLDRLMRDCFDELTIMHYQILLKC